MQNHRHPDLVNKEGELKKRKIWFYYLKTVMSVCTCRVMLYRNDEASPHPTKVSHLSLHTFCQKPQNNTVKVRINCNINRGTRDGFSSFSIFSHDLLVLDHPERLLSVKGDPP